MKPFFSFLRSTMKAPLQKRNSTHFRAGFTFIEIMVVVAVLNTGLLFVHEAMLKVIDGMYHLRNRNYASFYIDNKFWETEFQFRDSGIPPAKSEGDTVTANKRQFQWEQTAQQIDEHGDLYELTGTMSWREGGRTPDFSRTIVISK